MTQPDPHIALDVLLQALAEHLAEPVAARVAALVEARLAEQPGSATIDTPPASAYVDYIEPGPGSPRQYFEAKELARRWAPTVIREANNGHLNCKSVFAATSSKRRDTDHNAANRERTATTTLWTIHRMGSF